MDTKTLVVGQYVCMFSGCYGCEGKVVKVTPSGVDVQTFDGKQTVDGELLHFDDKGVSYDGTFVGRGPWHIMSLISKEEVDLNRKTEARNDELLLANLKLRTPRVLGDGTAMAPLSTVFGLSRR